MEKGREEAGVTFEVMQAIVTVRNARKTQDIIDRLKALRRDKERQEKAWDKACLYFKNRDRILNMTFITIDLEL